MCHSQKEEERCEGGARGVAGVRKGQSSDNGDW